MLSAIDQNKVYDVIIVGTGISGLMAAVELAKNGITNVGFVEARDRIGGRICDGVNWTGTNTCVGAEFVHGSKNNILFPYMEDAGIQIIERKWPEWMYDHRKREVMHYKDYNKNEELVQALRWIDNLYFSTEAAAIESGEQIDLNLTVADWLRKQGASPFQLLVADKVLAADFGCDLEDMALSDTLHTARTWVHEDEDVYSLKKGSYADLCIHLRSLAPQFPIVYNTRVTEVKYPDNSSSTELCEISTLINELDTVTYKCKRIISTIPINLLKTENPPAPVKFAPVKFSPELPAETREAIEKIQVGGALKVIVSFSKKFWPDNMYNIVTPGGFTAEFWAQRHERVTTAEKEKKANAKIPELDLTKVDFSHNGVEFAKRPIGLGGNPGKISADTIRDKDSYPVVCFFSGSAYKTTKNLTLEHIVSHLMDQLDGMFKLDTPYAKSHGLAGRPSDYLTSYRMYDWSRDPYCLGAYSHPSKGVSPSCREALSKPINDRLYFAGEATHPGMNICVQGAAETGLRAAQKVAVSLGVKEEDLKDPFTAEGVYEASHVLCSIDDRIFESDEEEEGDGLPHKVLGRRSDISARVSMDESSAKSPEGGCLCM